MRWSLECREGGSLARAHYRVSRHRPRATRGSARELVRPRPAWPTASREFMAPAWRQKILLNAGGRTSRSSKAVRHRQRPGPGGMSEIYYGPKVGRGCGQKMLNVLFFWKSLRPLAGLAMRCPRSSRLASSLRQGRVQCDSHGAFDTRGTVRTRRSQPI
jgi:hypothetical protein